MKTKFFVTCFCSIFVLVGLLLSASPVWAANPTPNVNFDADIVISSQLDLTFNRNLDFGTVGPPIDNATGTCTIQPENAPADNNCTQGGTMTGQSAGIFDITGPTSTSIDIAISGNYGTATLTDCPGIGATDDVSLSEVEVEGPAIGGTGLSGSSQTITLATTSESRFIGGKITVKDDAADGAYQCIFGLVASIP